MAIICGDGVVRNFLTEGIFWDCFYPLQSDLKAEQKNGKNKLFKTMTCWVSFESTCRKVSLGIVFFDSTSNKGEEGGQNGGKI